MRGGCGGGVLSGTHRGEWPGRYQRSFRSDACRSSNHQVEGMTAPQRLGGHLPRRSLLCPWGLCTARSSERGPRTDAEWLSERPRVGGGGRPDTDRDSVSLFAEEDGGDLVQPGIGFPGPADEDLGRAPETPSPAIAQAARRGCLRARDWCTFPQVF